jgi:hypothetical protein
MTDDLFNGNPDEGGAGENENSQQPTPEAEKGTQDASAQEKPESIDPNSLFADQLAEIKAEDGRTKYDSVDKALASIPYADKHIKELTDEVNELKQQLAQYEGLESMYEHIKEEAQKNNGATPAAEYDEASIEKVVENLVSKREQEARIKTNRDNVKTTLESQFGDKAEEMFKAKAQELEMSVAELTTLAGTHPKLVVEHFAKKEDKPSGESVSTVNTGALKDNEKGLDLEELRRTFMSPDSSESAAKFRETYEAVVKKYSV